MPLPSYIIFNHIHSYYSHSPPTSAHLLPLPSQTSYIHVFFGEGIGVLWEHELQDTCKSMGN